MACTFLSLSCCCVVFTINLSKGMCVSKAYEKGAQEVHCTWAQKVLGPGRRKAHKLSFSVINPKIEGCFFQLQRW